MRISRKVDAAQVLVGPTARAYEYPLLDPMLHGAVLEIKGRYPETERVVNEAVTEICYVIAGSGNLVVEDEEVAFSEGDQLLIRPGERYYWDAHATLYMPCTPAWYPEQHIHVH